MTVFKITTRDVVVRTYRVEAKTEQEATDKVLNGVPNNEDIELWEEYYEGADIEECFEEDKD